MKNAIERYRELLGRLLMERALAGGALPDETESRFVAELDTVWWTLSGDEQRRIEREISEEASRSAPVELGQQDRSVVKGGRTAPRKKAA
jgi:hypothetical protein